MQDNNLNKNTDQDEIEPQIQEALAVYFEQRNGGEVSKETIVQLSQSQQVEWQQIQALLGIPQKALEVRPTVESAWQNFRSRSFEVAPLAEPASLGVVVANALAQNEQSAIKESGLSKATLEALKADNTTLESLKGYELKDYAALARRYDVKDNAFPRMLKWLKALGKSLTLPSTGQARGMVFAREDEPRQPGLNQTQLAENLKQNEELDTLNDETEE